MGPAINSDVSIWNSVCSANNSAMIVGWTSSVVCCTFGPPWSGVTDVQRDRWFPSASLVDGSNGIERAGGCTITLTTIESPTVMYGVVAG